MIEHLPIFPVIIPFVLAPIFALLSHSSFYSRFFLLLVSVLLFALSLFLGWSVFSQDTVMVYNFGAFPMPQGIEYVVDHLSALMLIIVSGVNLAAAVFFMSGMEIIKKNIALFCTTWLLCIAGLNGMVLTNDAFNFFVFLEISSLSSYILISCGQNYKSYIAAYRYLIVGSVGATFLLLSIGLLYIQTGTLNIQDNAYWLSENGSTRTTLAALLFFVIGIGIKCALFPFHYWLPSAYQYAPNSITILLAGTSTKVALYVLLRFLYRVFNAQEDFIVLSIGAFFLAVAVLGILFAPLFAMKSNALKKFFAWSSVAQIGYIALGIGIGGVDGTAAALIHFFNHSLMKTMVFFAVGILIFQSGKSLIEDLSGAAHRFRLPCYVLFFGGISLVGIPGTLGFISKWYLLLAAWESGLVWLVVPIVVGSLGSALYVWRLIEILWGPLQTSQLTQSKKPIPIFAKSGLLVLVGLCLWFGIGTSGSYHLAHTSATTLLSL